jgi:hypothetical protein
MNHNILFFRLKQVYVIVCHIFAGEMNTRLVRLQHCIPHVIVKCLCRWRGEGWQILAPLLPPEKPGGRPRKYAMREVIDGIQVILRGGCGAWRLVPPDLPPWQTAYQCPRAWRCNGT